MIVADPKILEVRGLGKHCRRLVSVPNLEIDPVGRVSDHQNRQLAAEERREHRRLGGIAAKKGVSSDFDKIAKPDFFHTDLPKKVSVKPYRIRLMPLTSG
jgi:hypothetical protein